MDHTHLLIPDNECTSLCMCVGCLKDLTNSELTLTVQSSTEQQGNKIHIRTLDMQDLNQCLEYFYSNLLS